jgi:putative DNA primase/helicase
MTGVKKEITSSSFYKGNDQVLYRSSLLKQGRIQHTDRTNTARLVRDHGRDIRWNAAWKKWLVWNGKYWEKDDSEAFINERALKTIDSLYDDLPDITDIRDRLETEKFIILSESVRRREAFIKGAAVIPEMNVRSDDLDKNPWLINVENGTIDIERNEFREHRREDMITKMACVSYDPKADCPLWKKFICEVMGYNAELISFLQIAAGWAITGDTTEQVMFILFGSGANGKSTFLNTILYLLGEYAAAAQTQTFMRQTNDRMTNDLACLRGTRFVTTAEAEQGARLSEPLIKQITGNDKLKARFLFGEFFTFAPTFKLFMATNHKPVIKGTDYGIWRRIRLVPFTTRISEDKQDKYLEQKLRAEGSGILNWLIEGAARWHNEVLNAPPDIVNATDEYRGEMDVIGNFIKERCEQKAGVQVRIRELFKAYQDWCDGNNEHACSERFFGIQLKEMGFTQGRTSEARHWNGIMLRPSAL